jgi:hypothetical protein
VPKRIDVAELPVLKGQLTPPVAAVALRVKRQRVIQMIEEDKFRTATQVRGNGEIRDGQRPRPAAYLVREAEVRRLAVSNCPSCRYLTGRGAEIESCEHFEVTTRGEVILHDIAEVTDHTEPVEHAIPLAVSEHAARV